MVKAGQKEITDVTFLVGAPKRYSFHIGMLKLIKSNYFSFSAFKRSIGGNL